MIEYGKYHILEGIYPHIGLHIGPLAGGNIHNIKLIYRYISNNSEYDQEISQSQTADNPVGPRGRAAHPSRDTRKTN